MKAKRTPLERLQLTYGEGAEVEGLLHFMCWLKRESAPVPDTLDEAHALLARYIAFDRAERMAQVLSEVTKGQAWEPRTIKRIYRTGKARMSTMELDCGHKTEHATASIKKWQWFIGKTGMTCPTCDRAELTPEQATKFVRNLEADEDD